MYIRRILLTSLVLMVFMTGCGGKNNTNDSDVTMEESAVAVPTADSSDIIVEKEEEPEIKEEVPEVKEVEVEKKEEIKEEYVNDESEELTCVLPDGFETYPDEEGLYVHKSFPKDASTISYVISESDSVDVTKEDLEADLEADYLDAYGDTVDVKIDEFETIRIDGRKAVRSKLAYEFKGVEYEQLMCIIYNGADAHVLNFTQEKDGKWADDFEKCIESIDFE